jgi:hypothetical protein
MTRPDVRFLAGGLALAALLGLAVVAAAQLGGSAQQQYEQKLKTLDKTKVDDVYALAKWCLQNGLSAEAQTHALEALAKAPDDVRVKYLLYALTAGGETGEGTGGTQDTTGGTGGVEASITQDEIDQIYKAEGETVMKRFIEVQRVLTARCGSLKCHGGGNPSAPWVLVRRAPTTKKTLAANFRSVNHYIDRDDVAKSALLSKPLRKTEKHPEALHGNTDAAYRTVFSWMQSLKTAIHKIWENAATAPPPPPPPK